MASHLRDRPEPEDTDWHVEQLALTAANAHGGTAGFENYRRVLAVLSKRPLEAERLCQQLVTKTRHSMLVIDAQTFSYIASTSQPSASYCDDLLDLASRLAETGEWSLATQIAEQAVRHAESATSFQKGSAHMQYGRALDYGDSTEEAIHNLDQSRTILQGLTGEFQVDIDFENGQTFVKKKENRDVDHLIGVATYQLAHIYRSQERYDLALELYEQSKDIFERLTSAEPKYVAYQETLTSALSGIGVVYRIQGRLDDAAEILSEVLNKRRQLVDTHPTKRRYQSRLADTLYELGVTYRNQSFYEHAVAHLVEAWTVCQHLLVADPAVPTYMRQLAQSAYQLGLVYDEWDGRVELAIRAHRQAVATYQQLVDAHPYDHASITSLSVNITRLTKLESQ